MPRGIGSAATATCGGAAGVARRQPRIRVVPRPHRAVAVEVDAEQALVDRLDLAIEPGAAARSRRRRSPPRGCARLSAVDLGATARRRRPGGTRPASRTKTSSVRAVGRPEGAREGLVAHRAPAAAVARRSRPRRSRRRDRGRARRPGSSPARRQGRAQRGVVVVPDPGERSSRRRTVAAIAAAGRRTGWSSGWSSATSREGVGRLQLAVVERVAALAVGVAGPARVGDAAGRACNTCGGHRRPRGCATADAGAGRGVGRAGRSATGRSPRRGTTATRCRASTHRPTHAITRLTGRAGARHQRGGQRRRELGPRPGAAR